MFIERLRFITTEEERGGAGFSEEPGPWLQMEAPKGSETAHAFLLYAYNSRHIFKLGVGETAYPTCFHLPEPYTVDAGAWVRCNLRDACLQKQVTLLPYDR